MISNRSTQDDTGIARRRDLNPWLLCAMCALTLCAVPGARAADAEPTGLAPEIPERPLEAQCAIPFRDHAVLQQQIPVPVWGTARPHARVTVTYAGQTKTTEADGEGAWRVVLDPMTAMRLHAVSEAPEGHTMSITCELDGRQAVTEFHDIVVGEVWLGAGQSNMAGKMRSSVADANFPALRQKVSPDAGPWLLCTPETAAEFKRVCFFFTRRLQEDILVPVGVINAAVAGSEIEPWLNQTPPGPGGNYIRLIDPLVGFGLRGVIWYQGESNVKDGLAYEAKLRSLILGWREAWNQPASTLAGGPHHDFSVYFVQLPGLGASSIDNPAGGDGRAAFRQAQWNALAITNTGMSVGIDIGAEKEHPPNKYDVGVRLARWALHRDYGILDLVPSGPLYKDHQIEGNTVRIRFDYAEHGLMVAVKEGVLPPRPTPEAKLDWLAIQDPAGTWYWADGQIDGQELIVSCPEVTEPVAVRYAYTANPMGHLLYNQDGLPAGPFSTCGDGAVSLK